MQILVSAVFLFCVYIYDYIPTPVLPLPVFPESHATWQLLRCSWLSPMASFRSVGSYNITWRNFIGTKHKNKKEESKSQTTDNLKNDGEIPFKND